MFDHITFWLILAQTELESAAGGAAAPATEAAPAGGAGQPMPRGCGSQNPMELVIWMVIMFAVFYFLLIRPQQKRAKKHRELITSLKKGDPVITSSGIYGRIVDMDGNTVTLEVDKNTRIKVLRSHVGGRATPDTEKELAQTAGS